MLGLSTFSENGLSELNIITREFWFQISPASNESWTHLTQKSIEEKTTTLTSTDIATALSEVAFSQSSLSDLGLLLSRELWRDTLTTTNQETWDTLTPSGTESWNQISPSGLESWN